MECEDILDIPVHLLNHPLTIKVVWRPYLQERTGLLRNGRYSIGRLTITRCASFFPLVVTSKDDVYRLIDLRFAHTFRHITFPKEVDRYNGNC